MNFTINDPVRAQEAINRNKANVEWIKATFSDAAEKNASAVVIACMLPCSLTVMVESSPTDVYGVVKKVLISGLR